MDLEQAYTLNVYGIPRRQSTKANLQQVCIYFVLMIQNVRYRSVNWKSIDRLHYSL